MDWLNDPDLAQRPAARTPATSEPTPGTAAGHERPPGGGRRPLLAVVVLLVVVIAAALLPRLWAAPAPAAAPLADTPSSSAPSLSSTCSFSDHCTGLANDFMIAKWSTPAGNARGWQLAKWVQAHAAELNVTYIIFDVKVWRASAPDRGWAPYHHPYGNSSPTLAHRDHVHVSYSPPK